MDSRSRRRRSTQQAFLDRDPGRERCAQESRDCGDRIGEDSEIAALLVSLDACPSQNLSSARDLSPCSPRNTSSPSQDRCAGKEEGSVEEEEALGSKKRRSSSWSGLALPRIRGEKNAANDACKKLGFVVTRKMRALSLDDNLQDVSSRVNFLSTGNDGFLLKSDDSSLPVPSSPKVSTSHIDAHRCQSFDSRRYDLVGSPGPKILLANKLTAREEQGESSFKCPASVPFKWEEAPGKPKPATVKPDRSLQLPPRLLLRSATTNSSSGFSQRQTRSINHKQGMLLAAVPNAAVASAAESKPVSSGESTDPSSPTSILYGPDTSSASCSASSSDAISDSAVASDAESGTLSTAIANPVVVTTEDCAKGGAVGAKKVSFARSIERILHPDQWLRSKRKAFRGSQDVEMWAPTLAAYFHSIEGSDVAKDESASVPSSGQIVLLQRSDGEEDEVEFSSCSSSRAVSGLNITLESDGDGVGFEEGAAAGRVMYCGCASPRLGPSRFRLMRSGSSSSQRRWMVTRIRKSSRLLQMFVFKAVKCAVQSRKKSPVESSKLIYQPVKL